MIICHLTGGRLKRLTRDPSKRGEFWSNGSFFVELLEHFLMGVPPLTKSRLYPFVRSGFSRKPLCKPRGCTAPPSFSHLYRFRVAFGDIF